MKYQRISQQADEQEFLNSPAAKLVATDDSQHNSPTADDVAERAYHIYLREGAQSGNDWHHWFRAEEELRAERNGARQLISNNGNGTGGQTTAGPATSTRRGITSSPVNTRATAPAGAASSRTPGKWDPEVADLTKQAPHSPRDRLAGFAIARRAIDKCRATLAGKQGEYHFDCPVDNQLFSFKGLTGEEFKAEVKQATSAEEVGLWLQHHGTSRTPAEIEKWSQEVESASLWNDPAKRANFKENCAKLGLRPEKTTTFEWLEADDHASFSGSNKKGR